MAEYLKETALIEYGCDDMAYLKFAVNFEDIPNPSTTIIIRDTRGKPGTTHILSITSELEKDALAKGLYFLADTLEEKTFA